MTTKKELRGKIKEELRFLIWEGFAKYGDHLVRKGKVLPENILNSIHFEYEVTENIYAKFPELGYVRSEDMEIDLGRLVNMLSNYIVEKNILVKIMGGKEKTVVLDIILELAEAIFRAKEIIKVKEEK